MFDSNHVQNDFIYQTGGSIEKLKRHEGAQIGEYVQVLVVYLFVAETAVVACNAAQTETTGSLRDKHFITRPANSKILLGEN
jgi:hypothetical protein